ncbi:MAG: hypothetical protein ACRDQA_14575 [Nocardioidaceae bacterium]
MGAVIGDVLPLAIGVAISPIPIIAVILMLLSRQASRTSTGFLLGWGRRHASVPGVSWKTSRTPSAVSSWPVRVMSRLGGMSPNFPEEVAMPGPTPTWPVGLVSRVAPYM